MINFFDNIFSDTNIDDWTEQDVLTWFLTLKPSTKVLKVMENLELNGISLQLLHANFEEKFPKHIALGPRLFIEEAITELMNKYKKKPMPVSAGAVSNAKETLRSPNTFEKNSKLENLPGFKYIFLTENFETTTEVHQLGQSVMKHICACLNAQKMSKIVNGVDDRGTVQGFHSDAQHDTLEIFTEQLKRAFLTQQGIVQQCVTFSRLFPVTADGALAGTYIFEVTVSPNERCENELFEVRLQTSTGKKKKRTAYRYEGNELRIIKRNPVGENSGDKKNISKVNPGEEGPDNVAGLSEAMSSTDPGLKNEPEQKLSGQEKLRHLMVAENDDKVVDLYPILLVNAPKPANETEDQEDISLIGEIPWKAVFDFDSNASFCKKSEEKCEINIIPEIDWFSLKSPANISESPKLPNLKKDVEKTLQDHLQNEYHGPQWIFGNGYNSVAEKQVDAVSWKSVREAGFKEALKLYDNLIPNGRAIIIVMLFSGETEIILETLTEVTSVFRDRWIVIGDEKYYEGDMQELKRRNCIRDKDIEDRCVAGLSLLEIHKVFHDVFGLMQEGECEIPINYEGEIKTKKMDQKKLRKLTDIEVVTVNKGDKRFLELNRNGKQLIEQEELKYYNGCEVSWLNFRAEDHVFERKLVRILEENIIKATKPAIVEEKALGKVAFQHLPGAGGTTVARHTLWKLRQRYRCTVLKYITEHTAEQIEKVWEDGYEKSSQQPDPVVILADNIEEDSLTGLLTQMEDKAKQLVRRQKNYLATSAVFVFLICMRKTHTPSNSSLSLVHALSDEELIWWRDKYQSLEDRAKSRTSPKDLEITPDSLISFNIMKSDFDMKVIGNMAEKFVENITLPKERELLKYVALLNAFDQQFEKVPASGFDTLMADFEKEQAAKGHGKHTRNIFYQAAGTSGFIEQRRGMTTWVHHLSYELRVLMNDPTPYQQKQITNLRLVHPLLSTFVLDVLRKTDGGIHTYADMMKQFLDCSAVFNVTGVARNEIVDRVVNIVCKREHDPSKKDQTKYSLLIQHISDKEHFEDAIQIAERVLELSKNAFVAQLIARLYIYYKNWAQAEKYAQHAVKLLPENAALWDTYGRIYKAQLLEMDKSQRKEQNDMFQGIHIAREGVKCFQESLKFSKKANSGYGNNVGYQGEVEMGSLLLHYLAIFPLFKDRNIFADTLNRKSSLPAGIEKMCKENKEGREAIKNLRKINTDLDIAIASFEEELLHLKDRKIIPDSRVKENENTVNKMQKMKANIYSYRKGTVVEISNAVDEESCHMRRAQMRQLGANSFTSILELAEEQGGLLMLSEIQELCLSIIHSGLPTAEDFVIMLETSLALSQHKQLDGILYKDLVSWSKDLYKRRAILNEKKINLEPHLFYAMLNWPRKNNTCSTLSGAELADVLRNWKNDFDERYPRQRKSGNIYRKEVTTVFFLAKGKGVNSVVTNKILKSKVSVKGDNFWNDSFVKRNLQRFTGKATGDEIKVSLEDSKGNKGTVLIPTSLPIERSMHYKDVYFAIGFTWSGPKAYDVTKEEPQPESEIDAGHQAAADNLLQDPKPKSKSSSITFNDLEDRMKKIKVALKALDKKKLTSEEVSLFVINNQMSTFV